MDDRYDRAPIGIVEVTPSGAVQATNRRAAELLERESGDEPGTTIETLFPDSIEHDVASAFETRPTSDRTIEEYYPGLDRWLAVTIVPGAELVSVYVRDVTDRHRTERRLESATAERDRARSFVTLLDDLLDDIVTASNRDEIADTICARLGNTEGYAFAWVGERDVGADRFVMRSSNGDVDRTPEALTAALDAGADLPERRPVDDGHPVVVKPLGDAESVPESIRRAAFADGLQALLAVPITDGSTVHGVVGIYTADRNGFSERERRSLETIGKLAGFAITATRHRSVLLADSVVELSFELRDADAPFAVASEDRGAVLTIEGLVSRDGAYRCYVTVAQATPADVRSTLDAATGVRSTDVISAGDDGGTMAVTVADTTPIGSLLSLGASLQSATFRDGRGDVVVVFPREEDVRRIADAVTRRFDAEVTRKRERDPDLRDARKVRGALLDELTEKQREALRTALLADYFESPHGRSAEEIAETLGITGPTLLHHLRAGQRKLLEAVFDPDERGGSVQ